MQGPIQDVRSPETPIITPVENHMEAEVACANEDEVEIKKEVVVDEQRPKKRAKVAFA